MGIKVTIPDLGAVDNSSFLTDLNADFNTIETEFDKVIYQDGTVAMEGNLDMGSNRIYNLSAPASPNDAIRLADLTAYQVTYPNFTFLTGIPGSSVQYSGTYPNIVVTVPRGTPGSGVLVDGNYNNITVSDGGTVMSINNGSIGPVSWVANVPAKNILGNKNVTNGPLTYLTAAEVKSLLTLSNVDNTNDTNKPVSTPQQTALNLKADLASPVFTGNPTAPTAAPGDNDLSLATTAFVAAAIVAADSFSKIQTLPVLASAMYPRYTNGPGVGIVETSTNKVNWNTLDFDGASAEYAQFMVPMPKGWDEGTITVQFLWRSTGGTGGVVWGLQGVAVSDDDVADTAYGTAVTVIDSVTSVGDLMISAYTSAMTIAGTPVAEDLVAFQVYRDAASGSDTSTVDAQLVGIRIKYTTNARDDS